MVDTRVLGKPSSFSGDDEDPKQPWAQWSFVARAYFTAIDVRMGALLSAASAQSEAATSIDNTTLSIDHQQLSTTLYYALCLLCKDSALGVIKMVAEGHGFEAWRRLSHAYAPKVAARFQSMMEQVLYPTRPTSQHLKAIREWEDLMRRYEAQTGETISDMVRMATLTHRLVDDKLKDHLLLNARPNQTYKEVRDIAESVYVARRTWNESSANAAVDMDVDAMYKGKGKSKKGKDKTKGRNKGKPVSKIGKPRKSDAKCFYCNKPGHQAKECRKKARDEKEGKTETGGPAASTQQGGSSSVNVVTGQAPASSEGFVFMIAAHTGDSETS